MNLRLKKVWLWTKLIVVIVMVTWVILFFVFNREKKTEVWLFFGYTTPSLSLDVIIPITALASLVIFLVVRKIHGMLNDLAKIREDDRTRQRDINMESLARQVEQKLTPPEPPRAAGS